MLSGVQVSMSPVLNFTLFDAFATAVGCTQSPGPSRLDCLRGVPAATIRAYTNGPNSALFLPQVDKYALYVVYEVILMLRLSSASATGFDDPLERIRTGQSAQVPILLGSMQDDGIVFALPEPQNLSVFVAETFGSSVTPDVVRGLYPGLNDSEVISAVERDTLFRWCVYCLLRVKRGRSNSHAATTAHRNCGVMRLSRLELRTFTDTHTVWSDTLPFPVIDRPIFCLYLSRRCLRRFTIPSRCWRMARLRM